MAISSPLNQPFLEKSKPKGFATDVFTQKRNNPTFQNKTCFEGTQVPPISSSWCFQPIWKISVNLDHFSK